jgi:serine/threonine protein kinase
MAKCTNCGFDLPSDAIFCPKCSNPETGTISDILTVVGPDKSVSASGIEDGKEFHGRYVITRKLGAGAMGVVYLAADKVTARSVALKLINSALVNSTSTRERFIREGLVARDIRHPNVIAMYDVSESEGQVYLVMEYLPGETLRKWLHRTLQSGDEISFEKACGIMRKVLDGLSAAHATGVVHRDLKPENIILMGNPDEGNYNLKILDFGIARAIGEQAGKHVTTSSASTGTPLYMAPEQKTAADTVGPAADIYSATAIFYELLIGVAPTGRWELPSKERKELPSGIDDVVQKGLSGRPRNRYQSAQEYLIALDAVKDLPAPPPAPPVPPSPPTPTPVPGPTPIPKPHPKPQPSGNSVAGLVVKALVGAGIVLVLIVVAIIVIVVIVQNRPTTPVPEPPPVIDDNSGGVGPGPGPQPSPQPPPQPSPQPPPNPPPVSPGNIAGRWYDELTGTRIAIALVQINQNGNSVNGSVFTPNGVQQGTFTGYMNGTRFDYDWSSINGTGTGEGYLQPDGNHINIEVRNSANGLTERHTLHRDHLPSQ